MSSAVAFSWGEMVSLESLVASGEVKLGRGNVISKIDIQNNPGPYPIYSSSSKNDGKMGEYGDYMFDEEMISWSVDGGGYFFHRPKHKFSVTNVSGYMRLNSDWDYKFTAYSFQFQHGYFSFDYQTKAHPSVIREFYFLPKIPVAEQQKIATILSSVDDVIEKTRAQIDKLKDLKTGMMQELLTKGIGHTEFKDSPVGKIPLGWDVCTVSDIAKLTSGGTPDRQRSEYWNGSVPWVKTGEVNYQTIYDTDEKITALGLEESSAKLVPAGAVLMAMYGQGVTRGKVAKLGVAAAVNQACLAMIPNSRVLNDFLYYFFTREYFSLRSMVQEGAQKNLSMGIVKEIFLPVPPREEQKLIVSALQSVDIKIQLMLDRLNCTLKVKKALMQDLLTGKVRVNLPDKEQAAGL